MSKSLLTLDFGDLERTKELPERMWCPWCHNFLGTRTYIRYHLQTCRSRPREEE